LNGFKKLTLSICTQHDYHTQFQARMYEMKIERRKDEASQELFFACISFLILLFAAVADVKFHI